MGCSYSAGSRHDSASACTCLFFSSLLQSARCELFFPATSKLPSYKLRWEKTGNKSIWPRVFLARDPSLAHARALSPLWGKKKCGLGITAQKSPIYALAGSFSRVVVDNISSFIQKQHQKPRWWSVGRSVVIRLMCFWSNDQNAITPTELTTATSPSQKRAISQLRAISSPIWQPKLAIYN